MIFCVLSLGKLETALVQAAEGRLSDEPQTPQIPNTPQHFFNDVPFTISSVTCFYGKRTIMQNNFYFQKCSLNVCNDLFLK